MTPTGIVCMVGVKSPTNKGEARFMDHTIPNHISSVPAGWYPDPSHGVGQRYWDGQQWTEHVFVSGQQYTSPLKAEAEPEKAKIKIYWSNLFRIRTWWFVLAGPIGIMMLLILIGAPAGLATGLWTPLMVLFVAVNLTMQMACGSCGTALRVTRLSGQQDLCHKCGEPTDKNSKA